MGKRKIVAALAALAVAASCGDASTTSHSNGTTTTETTKSDPNVGPRINGAGGQPDHWHAAVGLNVCGEWQPGPLWPTRNGSFPRGQAASNSIYAGLHTHELADGTSDGVVHMEPASSLEAGVNATFGRFLRYGGWSVNDDAVALWAGQDGRKVQIDMKDYQCDGKPSKLRWALKLGSDPTSQLREQSSDVNRYKMFDNDVIAMYVVPADADLNSFGNVPSVVNLHGSTERGEGAFPYAPSSISAPNL